MAWLESHGNLARHPKTRRLMQRMGWTLPHTIGNLHLLWYWALEYAPTGDLTKFESDQLTYDLDLGNATPEQFIQALIDSGFLDETLDKNEDRVLLRLHDWPDYTTKSLRPRFRKTPDRWHNVLRSYGLPIPQRRNRIRTGGGISAVEYEPLGADRIDCGEGAARQGVGSGRDRSQYEPPGADRIDCAEGAARQGVGSGRDRSQNALRAVRGISTHGSDENTEQHTLRSDDASDVGIHCSSADTVTEPDSAQNGAPPETITRHTSSPEDDVAVASSNAPAPIPEPLSTIPTFKTPWWPKFLQMYQDKGCPLTTIEQTKVLERLAEAPSTALQRIKKSFKNPLINLPAAQPAWTGAEAITNTS